MTQDQERRLELIRADVSPEVATMLDTLFAAVEGLQFANRRLSGIVAALEERMEPVELVQSGPFDPRD